jgi:hypothetical protein
MKTKEIGFNIDTLSVTIKLLYDHNQAITTIFNDPVIIID